MEKPTDQQAANPDAAAGYTSGSNQDGPGEVVAAPRREADKQPDSSEAKRRDPAEKDWERQHSKWSLWINGIIGFFAISGFCALVYQIESGEEDSRAARAAIAQALQHAQESSAAVERAVALFEKTTAQQQRPWVVFKEIQHSQGAAKAVFRNVGPLPAAKLRGEVIYAFIKYSSTFPPEKADPEESRIIAHGMGETVASVGGGEEYAFLIRFPMGFQYLEQRGKTFYIYGTVKYEDLSKTTRTTRFCAYLYDDRWNGCGRHNSAD